MKYGLVVLMAFAFPFTLRAGAASAWPFWASYETHFVSAEGRVADPDRNSMTTSEGQSYAMFFALVAGDAASFERIRIWTENNLAHGDLGANLPAWSWGKTGNGTWGVLDPNSASDADLWIAYSLIQAGRLWQKPLYARSGHALLSMIARKEVAMLPEVGPVLLPGRTELFSSHEQWVLNESYLPLPLIVAAAHASPEGPWKQMASALPNWLERASPSGFAMDWVEYKNGGFSAVRNPGDDSRPASGSYDAIRVYLWAGLTDKETPGAERLLKIFLPMAESMKTGTTPPEVVAPNGTILSTSSPVGFSAALLPFLAASGQSAGAKEQLRLVNEQSDRKTGLLGTHARYYDQNLALFGLGWQEQRFRFSPEGELRVQWKN